MKDIIIIDLDGTLCNDAHRNHLALAGEWDEFHSKCPYDVPHEDVAALLRMCEDETVVVITGRNERYRALTLNWFQRTMLAPYVDWLLMRPDDDYSPIGECKVRLLEEWAMSDGNCSQENVKQAIISRVRFVLDDRDKMVEAWRAYGLPCWQVRPAGY